MLQRIRSPLLLCFAVSACQAPAPPDQSLEAEPSSLIEGAWQMAAMEEVSADGAVTSIPTYESMVLFSGGYYSMAFSRGDHRSLYWSERWNATDEERLDRFSLMTVNTGSYELTETTLVTRPLFALVPEFVGGMAEQEFSISGDQLTLTVTNVTSTDGIQPPIYAEGGRVVYHLERIDPTGSLLASSPPRRVPR